MKVRPNFFSTFASYFDDEPFEAHRFHATHYYDFLPIWDSILIPTKNSQSVLRIARTPNFPFHISLVLEQSYVAISIQWEDPSEITPLLMYLSQSQRINPGAAERLWSGGALTQNPTLSGKRGFSKVNLKAKK